MTFRGSVRGVLGGTGAAAVAAALLTGSPSSSVGSPTAGPTVSPTVSPAAASGGAASAEPVQPHRTWTPGDLAQAWAQLPGPLREDLAALRTVPATERPAVLEQIRDDALAGAYGAQSQARAERLVAGLALLPPALVADLEGLAVLEVAAVPDGVERIRDRALAGGYGPQVRASAARLVTVAGRHGVDVRGDLDRFLTGSYLPGSWG